MLCKITATFHSPARPCDENHCSPSLESGKYNNIEQNIIIASTGGSDQANRLIALGSPSALENRKTDQMNYQINTEKGGRNASEKKIVYRSMFAYLCSLYFPLGSDVLSTRVCSVNLISSVDNVVENVEVTNYGNIFSENPPNCCTPTWHNGPVTRLYGKPFANVLIMPL